MQLCCKFQKLDTYTFGGASSVNEEKNVRHVFLLVFRRPVLPKNLMEHDSQWYTGAAKLEEHDGVLGLSHELKISSA